MFGKSSNDTQENPKDAQKSTKPIETTELNSKIAGLSADKENLTNQLNASQKQVKDLQDSKQVLENEKADLTNENTKLKTEKTDLTEENKNLTTEKENLTTALSTAKSQAE